MNRHMILSNKDSHHFTILQSAGPLLVISLLCLGICLPGLLLPADLRADETGTVNRCADETIDHIVAYPEERKHETPIFLQHGFLHSSSGWEQFMDYLATYGYVVHAISLPGHGESSMAKEHVNKYSMYDYLDCMSQEIARISPPPVVIGHSLGGFLILKYLETNELPGAVFMASAPHKGSWKLVFRLLRVHPIKTLKAGVKRDLQIESPEIARELFFSEDTDIDMQKFFDEELEPLSTKAAYQMVFRIRAHPEKISTPTFVIAAENDFNFSVKEQERLADALDARFMLLHGQAHEIMLEPSWSAVVDVIDRWITEDLGLP